MKVLKHIDEHFNDWFLEYSSYVVKERAIPNMDDGLKPVQRRILHAMKKVDDGTLHKVQSLVGEAVKLHPHGDMAIKDALVNLGQKNTLIETQGNWGNILTGDGAAAGRYIEARLSKLAKNFVFNPKITEFIPSYDSKYEEPVALPIKFPLLLLQGAEGIAVGLSCKILPHNPREVIEACISYLRKETFQLFPDFVTGGSIDVDNYNDGRSGGKIKCRAVLKKDGSNAIVITELPFGTNTTQLRDSIALAAEKGKIKVKSIEDLTSSSANIRVEFYPGQDMNRAEEALYAFTACETPISVNAVTILNKKPVFTSISEILVHTTNRTRDLIKAELELELRELDNKLHRLDLEQIFIVNRIYKVLETSKTHLDALINIREQLLKLCPSIIVTDEDIDYLTGLKLRRISKYDQEEHSLQKQKLEDAKEEAQRNLKNLTKTVIRHFRYLLDTHFKDAIRKTKISKDPFLRIEQAAVSAETLKVYCNRSEGFIGTNLKKDEILPFEVNPLTDVLAISRVGTLKIGRVGPKTFFGENIVDVRIFDKTQLPVYNLIYTNTATGTTYYKKFQIPKGFVRDREYLIAGGVKENQVIYLEEDKSQKVRAGLTGKNIKVKELEVDFSQVICKNRDSLGNILTKNKVSRIKT